VIDAQDDSKAAALPVDTALPPDAAQAGKIGPSGRDARGRFVPGNAESLTHGARAYERRGVLPPDVAATVDAFRAQLEADRGGAAETTAIEGGYCRRLCQLEGVLELLGRDIAGRGILTPRGRPRSAYRSFLVALGVWDRYAQRLGLSRKPRAVESLERYLERRRLETAAGSNDDDRARADRSAAPSAPRDQLAECEPAIDLAPDDSIDRE